MKSTYRESIPTKIVAVGFIILILLSNLAVVDLLFGQDHAVWMQWGAIVGFGMVFFGGLGLLGKFFLEILDENK